MNELSNYPDYLGSFIALQQHFRAQLEGLSATEKGDRFAHFVQRLIPQTEVGTGFDLPELNSKLSGDGGVDLIAQGLSNETTLYIQSKLWVDRADIIDSVISKFQAYTTSHKTGQASLFDLHDDSLHFLLVTLSPLKGILDKYQKKEFASKEFYRKCKAEDRIHFIDGEQILPVLKATYSKLNQLPTELVLNFETPFIQKDNVYIGVMSSVELKSLYRQSGDALFFENVRDFLGVSKTAERLGRTTPNHEIIKTVTEDPGKMLSRNNGIVFGADEVLIGASPKQLIIGRGSVVNGCQTTMCLVEYAGAPSYILVKVVQTDDSWDITKSANYQTSVPDIDLELARYLRPQLVKRAAANLGVQIKDTQKSVFQLIDDI